MLCSLQGDHALATHGGVGTHGVAATSSWTNRLLTSASTCPSLRSPPSVRPGSNPLRTPGVMEISHLCWEEGSLLPPKHLSSSRQLTSSAWPGRSMASFFVLASQTLRVLSLLPLTSKRLSADQAIWYTADTWPLSDVRYLGTRTGW